MARGDLPRYDSYSLLVSHFLLYGWISIFSCLCGHRFFVLVWIGGSICLSGFNETRFQENLNENLRGGRKTDRESFSGMFRNREERRNEFFWRLRGFQKFFGAWLEEQKYFLEGGYSGEKGSGGLQGCFMAPLESKTSRRTVDEVRRGIFLQYRSRSISGF